MGQSTRATGKRGQPNQFIESIGSRKAKAPTVGEYPSVTRRRHAAQRRAVEESIATFEAAAEAGADFLGLTILWRLLAPLNWGEPEARCWLARLRSSVRSWLAARGEPSQMWAALEKTPTQGLHSHLLIRIPQDVDLAADLRLHVLKHLAHLARLPSVEAIPGRAVWWCGWGRVQTAPAARKWLRYCLKNVPPEGEVVAEVKAKPRKLPVSGRAISGPRGPRR